MFISFVASFIAKAFAQNIGLEKPVFFAALLKWSVLIFTFVACLIYLGLPPEVILIGVGIAYVTLCITFVIAFGVGGAAWAGKILGKLTKE
jgi:hypothetical protein